MGDASTHAIFHNAYWHLAFIEDGVWVGTEGFSPVCNVGEEDAKISLIRPSN